MKLNVLQSKVMKHNRGNKVTFKTEEVIMSLISQFFKMRGLLYQLIDRSPCNNFSDKQILAICKELPKSLQRNKNRYNEQLLCQELKNLLQCFVSTKPKSTSLGQKRFFKEISKRKPYELFLLFKQFTEIVANRIKASMSGNLQILTNNHENYKLFYLINEMQFLNCEIQSWATRQDKKMLRNRHQSVEFIYPDSTTNRKTLATTCDGSKNLSKYEKSETIQEFNQKASEYCLLRANTAKLQKKELKLTMRCPSAVSILKNQSYKQPLFESRKPILKYKHKSTDFEAKTHHNFELPENNVAFDTPQNSRLRQTKLTVSKERKISILNKSLKDDEEGLRIKNSKKFLIENDKLKKAGFSTLARRKKDFKATVVSNEQINSDKNVPSSQNIVESQCQILDPQAILRVRERKQTNISFKQIKIGSRANVQSESSQEDPSLQSSFWEKQQNTIYIRQRQIYKKARRSGKVMVKDHDDLKDVYMINAPKKKELSNFSKRRKAIRSTHNDEMSEIKNFANAQKQEKAKKQLQYDENVLLAVSDALKSRVHLKHSKENEKQTAQINYKQTVNSMFQQMNVFLKNYFNGKPSETTDSVFFEQQKRIRCFQDHNFREKMKEIIKIEGSSNIFEIVSSQINNKDQIYSQIHRYLTFNSDTEWIKHMSTLKQPLIQKSL